MTCHRRSAHRLKTSAPKLSTKQSNRQKPFYSNPSSAQPTTLHTRTLRTSLSLSRAVERLIISQGVLPSVSSFSSYFTVEKVDSQKHNDARHGRREIASLQTWIDPSRQARQFSHLCPSRVPTWITVSDDVCCTLC
jgi:hypothetical protein